MKYLFLIYITLCCIKLNAQVNLVPNYSFEQYSTCPTNSVYSLTLATNWLTATTNGTPDYFNGCSNFTGVPTNVQGFQSAKTGNGYAGLFAWIGPTVSNGLEYVQIKLHDSLKSNKQYCIKYFVSRAENEADYSIPSFGAYLSDTLLNVSTNFNINVVPQVNNNTNDFKSSFTNWEVISGTYTAAGHEKFLIIGNFNSVSDTIFDPYDTSQYCRVYCRVYYYIDDVTVEEVANAQAGADKIINCGDSIVVGADSAIGAYYKWTPNIGLSNDSIAFPVANPTVTTTYLLKKQQCSIITYDTVKITVNNNCQVIGIEELAFSKLFKIYPNPAKEQLTIEADIKRSDQAVITICNIMGEIVLSEKITSGKTAINTSNLNNGTYLYRIIIDGNIAKTDKLIIIK